MLKMIQFKAFVADVGVAIAQLISLFLIFADSTALQYLGIIDR